MGREEEAEEENYANEGESLKWEDKIDPGKFWKK